MKQIYKYKQKNYFIESTCQLKDPNSRQWKEAVIYVSMEDGQRCCRLAEEFYERFEEVTEVVAPSGYEASEVLIDELVWLDRQTFWGQE